jgi:predicted transposase YdaD
MVTLAERLIRRGRQEGFLEGLQEGRQAVLQRLFGKRFGIDALDMRLQERLRTATPEQLYLWAERILEAATVEDVFADSPQDTP